MTKNSLSKTQQTLVERALNPGTSDMAVALDENTCIFLAATIARDLDRKDIFPTIDWPKLAPYFQVNHASIFFTQKMSYIEFLSNLFHSVPDSDAYFACLATLHKSRLKYDHILRKQPLPTFDQIGPRGLLQFGRLGVKSLMDLLYWRKWLYDLDNRAAQDTGYLFEPILAHAIGGTPVSASKSPVKRSSDEKKGRQVDCIRRQHAYELKLRVTISASGQGRWQEELEFPADCRNSGYTPVLVVFDPTPNPKLKELVAAFQAQDGKVFIGTSAWEHLESEAGATMSKFLRKYIRDPLTLLMEQADTPPDELCLRMDGGRIALSVGDEILLIDRESSPNFTATKLPGDVDEDLPGI